MQEQNFDHLRMIVNTQIRVRRLEEEGDVFFDMDYQIMSAYYLGLIDYEQQLTLVAHLEREVLIE